MENNVIISIQGKQSFEAQGDDTIELVTEGCLEPDGDDGYTLSYQESELTGLEGTLTTFQIERDRVTLLRVGEVNSQMVFEEGRRHLSMYDCPWASTPARCGPSWTPGAAASRSTTPSKSTTRWRARTCSASTCGRRGRPSSSDYPARRPATRHTER